MTDLAHPTSYEAPEHSPVSGELSPCPYGLVSDIEMLVSQRFHSSDYWHMRFGDVGLHKNTPILGVLSDLITALRVKRRRQTVSAKIAMLCTDLPFQQ